MGNGLPIVTVFWNIWKFVVCKFFSFLFFKIIPNLGVLSKKDKNIFFPDCTPPHRVTIVTDNTNFAETITPTAESATVLSQGI